MKMYLKVNRIACASRLCGCAQHNDERQHGRCHLCYSRRGRRRRHRSSHCRIHVK